MSGLMMKYFVLKPSGFDPYAIASRTAMFAYAKAIRKENPDLAKDLADWALRESANVNIQGEEDR